MFKSWKSIYSESWFVCHADIKGFLQNKCLARVPYAGNQVRSGYGSRR